MEKFGRRKLTLITDGNHQVGKRKKFIARGNQPATIIATAGTRCLPPSLLVFLVRNLQQIFRKRAVPVFTAITAALGLALCCSIALAQSGAGTIQGTVTDATGAVIPGASIQVVNQATGVVSNAKSNSVGFYQVPDLFAGTYAVTFTVPNMKTDTATIQLLVAQDAVINPVMTAGAVTQKVTVSGNTIQLTNTDNGSISSYLDNAGINQLPMNGRSLMTLVNYVAPGMEQGQTGSPTIEGLPNAALDYVIDGASTTNILQGGNYFGQEQLIDPDSVQEMNIQMSDGGAQYAFPSTAIITTKSGTNSLHGSFFETARNNGLGIAKDRQDPSTYSAPHYVRNEFGASAGGPIILPHVYHGKDKSFWFFAFERYSLATDAPTETKVPTMAMRQGDFSGLINSAGVTQQLYDPSTTSSNPTCPTPGTVSGVQQWNAGTPVNNPYCRTPFGNGTGGSSGNNQIPIGEISPVAKVYYQVVPQPTSTANPLAANNLNILNPDFQVMPQVTVRLDHVFNENNRAYLRYSQVINAVNTALAAENVAADNIPAGAAEGYANNPTWSYIGSIGYTHTFSPTFFSETVASQEWFTFKYEDGTDPTVDYEAELGLPNNFGEEGFPNLGNGTLINNLTGGQNYTAYNQIISMLDENLTKTAGRHQIQFGGKFRHTRVMDLPEETSDLISFSTLPTALYNTASAGNYTALTNTGYADGSLFLGSPTSYSVTLEPPRTHYHMMEFDPYAQDNYHVSKHLTVNLGLRFEDHPALWYKYGLMNGFDLKNDAVVETVPLATLIAEGYTTQAIITNDENIGIKFETPAEAGLPSTLLKNYYLLLPRASIAYQPFGGRFGTVIRGGYGRYSYPEPVAFWNNQVARNNPFVESYSQNYALASQAKDALPNELIRYNDPAVFGEMGVSQANAVNSNVTNAILPGLTNKFLSPNLSPTIGAVTNVTVEQAFKGNSALRVSWIWSRGTHLLLTDAYNGHPSNFQWETATGTVPPNGTVIGSNQYAATATGPYDQTTWGANTMVEPTGWSDYNGLQVNYQRLFHHGSAFQISYVLSKSLSTSGDAALTVYPDANYPGVLGTVGTITSPYGTMGVTPVPPPVRPANLPVWEDWHAMDKYQTYTSRASYQPPMHIRFNGIVDLPVGRGKRFLGNANRFVNELVGGFQLAGDGQILNQVYTLTATYYGSISPIVTYKHKYPIMDCRSGNCYKAYMWANGYLAPTVLPAPLGTCTTNCVNGLPSTFVPLETPIDNTPGTTYYGTNDVQITAPNINSGKPTAITYDAGPAGANPYGKTILIGPTNWNADLSLFKVFPITERVNLRFNVDAFNAFNNQGWAAPLPGGVEEVQAGVGQTSSFWSPRQIQLTMRLSF